MIEERTYQSKMDADIRDAYRRGKRRLLVVLPTGGGKTIVGTKIIEKAVAKARAALFLAPRRELIYQTSEKLKGTPHGIIMAGEPQTRLCDVQVACVPTLYSRVVKHERMPMPNAAVVLVDEAHLARGEMTEKVIAEYPDAVLIGLTATPARADGKGLGKHFDEMILGPSVAELIRLGYLVPPKYFVPSTPDLRGVKVTGGDYNSKQLGDRMNNKTLVGDVLTNWLRLGKDRKTVIFTVDVAHSQHIEQTFREAGIAIAHLDASTPKEERRRVLKDLREGRIQVITNCDILTMGWDEPSISCCVMARPTKSLVRYLQAGGRVLRPSPGKTDCLILDHGGCTDEHGLLEDERAWSLNETDDVSEKSRALREKQERKDLVCTNCTGVFKASSNCPHCGAPVLKSRRLKVDTIDDELAELDASRRRKKNQRTVAEKQQFYAELVGYAIEHKHSHGSAAHRYREKFGEFPPREWWPAPQRPSAETLAWVKSRQIAYRKGIAKQAAREALAAGGRA